MISISTKHMQRKNIGRNWKKYWKNISKLEEYPKILEEIGRN